MVARTALSAALFLGFGLGAPGGNAEEEGELAPTFAASELLPFSPRRARFLLREADGTTREIAWSRLPAEDGEERWRVEAPGLQAALLERGEDGRVQILSHWDHRKGRRIDYTPPALLLPALLEPDAESRSESEVVVYDSESGTRKTSGTCVHVVRLVGERTVETPAGRFRAVRVDLSRTVDVLIAGARVTIELAFVPGRGRVLERIVERVRFLGFGGGRELHVLELLAESRPGED